MKTIIKKYTERNIAKINSTVKVDKKLDDIKNIRFESNKLDEIKKIDFRLSF